MSPRTWFRALADCRSLKRTLKSLPPPTVTSAEELRAGPVGQLERAAARRQKELAEAAAPFTQAVIEWMSGPQDNGAAETPVRRLTIPQAGRRSIAELMAAAPAAEEPAPIRPSYEHTTAITHAATARAADLCRLSAYACGCWPRYTSCRCHDRDIRNVDPKPKSKQG